MILVRCTEYVAPKHAKMTANHCSMHRTQVWSSMWQKNECVSDGLNANVARLLVTNICKWHLYRQRYIYIFIIMATPLSLLDYLKLWNISFPAALLSQIWKQGQPLHFPICQVRVPRFLRRCNSSLSFSSVLLLLLVLLLLASSSARPERHFASSGCCEERLGPNTCQREFRPNVRTHVR